MAKAKKASKRKNDKKVESSKASSKSETITLTKTNVWQIVSGVLALALIVVLVIGLGSGSNQAVPTPGNQPAPGGQQPAPTGNVEVSLEGANTLGDEDAPVVFVEYSSFTCPFCGRYNSETYPQILSEYVESGDVLYVYKHFLRNEVDATAANAAECAGDQGAFFEYKAQLYENQGSLNNPAFFSQVATDLGLDVDEWQTCFDSEKYTEKALADRNEGVSNGIQGTPGFIIDGTPFTRGAQPFSVFQAEIERALN
jgi:protein-disulfide isomerase